MPGFVSFIPRADDYDGTRHSRSEGRRRQDGSRRSGERRIRARQKHGGGEKHRRGCSAEAPARAVSGGVHSLN